MMPSSFVADPALKLLEGIFDGLADGILVVNEDGEIQLSNNTALKQLGYQAENLAGTLIFTVNPHLNLLSWKKLWKGLDSGEITQEQTEFMHSGGTLLPVKTISRRLHLEDSRWIMISVEFLLESQRFYDLLNITTEVGKICSWELDMSTKQLLMLGEVKELLGLPEQQNIFQAKDIRKVFMDHVSGQDIERLKGLVKKLIQDGERFETEVVFNQSDGSFDRLQISAEAFRTEFFVSKLYGTISKAIQLGQGQEEHYLSKFTLDHVSDLVFWVRKDSSIAYVNKSVCDRLGYTRKEMLKMKSRELTSDYGGYDREAFWQLLKQEKHVEAKYKLRTKSGEYITVLSSSNYLVYEGVEYNCAFSKDITQQEKENDKLKLTQFSIENSHEMILWVQYDGVVFYANKAFRKNTGYEREDLQQLSILDILEEEELFSLKENNWEKLRNLGEFDTEATLWCKNESYIPTYCTFNHLQYEEKAFICIYIRDWRRKKKRDVQLFMAQNALDSARDMVLWIDENQKIAYKNVAAREKLGYLKGELKGTALKEVYPELDLKHILSRETAAQLETEAHMKNGKIFPVEISISPAHFKGNRYTCLIVRDIRERKKNQQKLLESKQKIEQLSLKLKDENVLLREEIYSTYNFNDIITKNKDYRNVLGQVAQVADSNATVLIQGETGTGKELLARAIYSLSDREDRAFIKVNCAALPENLIESELFGHEKGAFTGAIQQKKGRFELADKGTIFLDEIGELPLDLQAKLLRVLQEGEFERLGGTSTIKVDVRIVAATNRNLEEMVEKGTFREDLFYRLNVFPIANPPLRDRKEDIPLLVKHFSEKYGKRMGKKIHKISQADISELEQYDFPGNIRELENMVERAMILAKDGVLNLKASFDLVREHQLKGKDKRDKKEVFLSFEEMQREHIVAALKKCNMRVTGPKGAARLLELNDRTLMSKMRKLGIKREDYL